MKEHHYFASANTCEGFKNHFGDINPNNFTYIIKGGPGTGKSSLMKSVGEHFAKKGYKVEYFHCSSDMDSLDGVRIVEKNVAMLDGTAPHVTEATLPQVTEKIVNVGEFISGDITKHKENMMQCLAKKSMHFSNAYGYLSACKELVKMEINNIKITNKEAEDKANEVIKSLKIRHKKNAIKARSLFITCIDKGGIKGLENEYKNVITIDEHDYFAELKILNEICCGLEKMNANYIKLLSPLLDNLVEGIYIESIDTLIIAKSQLSNTLINALINKAGYQIDKARHEHKKVEKYYIKAMQFEKLNILRQEIIQEISEK